MHKNIGDLTIYKKITKLLVIATALSFVGCAKNSSPSSEEIFPTIPPTVFNQSHADLTTPSSIFTVQGTCSTEAYGLEYSVDDGATWTDVPGDCLSNGTYSLSVLVLQIVDFAVRSKTQFAQTSSATAEIRLILPPNSPLLQFVASSGSPMSSITEPVISFTMPWALSGERMELGGSYKIDTHVTGAVHGP